MRGFIYTRVSTDEQAAEGFSLSAQEDLCREKAMADHCTSIDVYCDDGYSAATMDRPALQALLKSLRKNDMVYVYRLDRLSRDVEHMAVILKMCQSRSVKIVPIVGSADVSTSLGRAFTNMQAVWAQLEREQLGERVAMGMQKRVAEGKPYSRVPFGFTSEGGVWAINEEEARAVRLAFELRSHGYGMTLICKRLDEAGLKNKGGRLWQSRGVWHMLRNPAYVGDLSFGDVHRKDAIPAIVSRELWDEVQRVNLARQSSRTRTESQYLLSGLVFCECGRSMGGYVVRPYKRKDGTYSKYPSYRCIGRAATPASDHNNVVMAKALEEYVLTNLLNGVDTTAIEVVAPVGQEHALHRRIESLDAELMNLEAALLQGRITGERFDRHKERLERELAEVRLKEQQSLDQAGQLKAVAEAIQRQIRGDILRVFRKKGSSPELKALIAQFVERIVVSRPDGKKRGLDSRKVTIHVRLATGR